MKSKVLLGLAFIMILTASCNKKEDNPAPPSGPAPADTSDVSVTVDCAIQEGDVIRIEQTNDMSTSSPLPGEKAKEWLQSLHHKVIRVWIQLRYVYNKGNIDYNYQYSGSGVPVEDALAFYSQTADSLLIVLSAYNATQTWPLPARGADFQQFVKETVIYYKQKFPKIKYIQVGNEPDYGGETVAEYYPVYQDYYRGINEANATLNLQGNNRLLISNGAFTSTSSFKNILSYSGEFLAAYAADTDPGKKLDFFSFHCYTESDFPVLLLNDKKSIDSIMAVNGLPDIPVFVTEFGLVGGSFIPSVWDEADAVTAEPAGQLTKAYYLYKGGISKVFNWGIYHGTIVQKSELADLTHAFLYPYGNALSFCKEISDRKTQVKADSRLINNRGLGVHVLASMGNGKGIAALVWNYNWTKDSPDKSLNVLIKNIPVEAFPDKKMKTSVYLIDSKHNNYYTNKKQESLKASVEGISDYKPYVKIPLTLEKNAVALILITPQP